MPYDRYRQRVRQHRRSDVVVAVSELNTRLHRAEFGEDEPLELPNVVQPFSLAGVARTALVAGNDYRNRPVQLNDLVEMCAYYANVAEPHIATDAGIDRLRWVLNHIAYEQFGHQFSAMENVGRTLVLLGDQCGPQSAGAIYRRLDKSSRSSPRRVHASGVRYARGRVEQRRRD